jgi:hypothetical protein
VALQGFRLAAIVCTGDPRRLARLQFIHRGRGPRHTATAPLATLSGDALTDLLAGLAANSIGSFVKGLTPLRASSGLVHDRHFDEAGNDELAGLVQPL